jgi:hypothetical protein
MAKDGDVVDVRLLPPTVAVAGSETRWPISIHFD